MKLSFLTVQNGQTDNFILLESNISSNKGILMTVLHVTAYFVFLEVTGAK